MDAPLKELAKLEKLTSNSSGNGKSPSINDILDTLLQSLYETKQEHHAGAISTTSLAQLAQTTEGLKKEIEDRQREIYQSVSRIGKALDKVCFDI
jgi:E3 ubiquitin-protein transferase RMND5